MDRKVVTGYCWPQSVSTGEQVGLHMSASSGRRVRVEVARVGAQRDIVFSANAIPVGDHKTPTGAASKGCDWPIALTLDVDPAWRSGYYEVVMEIAVHEKVRRDYAFFVVRPSSGARIVMALTLACAGRWRPATSTSRRARVDASRGRVRPIRRTPHMSATSKSITCRAMPGRRAGPIGSCPS